MCMQQHQLHKIHCLFPQRRNRVRILSLSRREQRGEDATVSMDMELENLKLYRENMSMVQENEKLRKQANLLRQENLALMSEFRNRLSKSDNVTVTPLNGHMFNVHQTIRTPSLPYIAN